METNGREGLNENVIRRTNLLGVQYDLIDIVGRIKENRELMPCAREMIEISMRIPNTIYKYKEEFTFAFIEKGSGPLEQMEIWAANLEKRDSTGAVVLEAYLYPYKGRGRKLMEKVLKYALPLEVQKEAKPLKVEYPGVINVRRKAREEIKRAVVEHAPDNGITVDQIAFVPMKEIGHEAEISPKVFDVFSNPEGAISMPLKVEQVISENYCNGFKQTKVKEIPQMKRLRKPKRYYDVYENADLSPVSVESEKIISVQKNDNQTGENLVQAVEEQAVDSPPAKENHEIKEEEQIIELPVEENAKIKIVEQLDCTEVFLNAPIDYDYRKWNLWSTDGTRAIIKKTFVQHYIETPADLMSFLGTNAPTINQWNNFIDRLNRHNSSVKLIVGASSKHSLLKWMRKYGLIPMVFKKNY